MPLRDAKTPTPQELDALAECTPADMERAASLFKRAIADTPRRSLRTIIDATVEANDPATGPMPDES
jgi:hypothetical protein